MTEKEKQILTELFPEEREEMEVKEYVKPETYILKESKDAKKNKLKKINMISVISIVSIIFIILLFFLGHVYRSELIQKNEEVMAQNSVIEDRVGSMEQRMNKSEEDIYGMKEQIKKSNEQMESMNQQLEDVNQSIWHIQSTLKSINDSIKEMYDNLSKKIEGSFKKDSSIKGKTFDMKATVYDLSVESCGKLKSHPEYVITYSGSKSTKNRTVAVDPRVIPLGSTLYIRFPHTYSHMNGNYIAEDTGSAIKGNKVDIFLGEYVPQEYMMRFGIQPVKVTVLS